MTDPTQEHPMQMVTEDNITELAVQRWGTAHDPRLAEVVTSLVRHLHDFAREVRLTEDEWMAAIQWLTRTGQMSDDKRQEFILASDVLGLSMLVVQLNHRFDDRATPATVLGPFHIDGSPELGYAGDMAVGIEGDPLYIHGVVRDLEGKPVPDAVLDVWQADGDGAYEAQLGVDEARLRGKFASRDDGTYCVRTITPKGYTIPMDGTVGDLIGRTDISHFRPAHVHFLVTAPGFEPLITHLFEQGGPIPRQRRGLRDEGTARRPLRAARVGDGARRVVVGAVDRRGLRLRAAAHDLRSAYQSCAAPPKGRTFNAVQSLQDAVDTSGGALGILRRGPGGPRRAAWSSARRTGSLTAPTRSPTRWRPCSRSPAERRL